MSATKKQVKKASMILRGLAKKVDLADLRGFVLGLSVTALHEEKGSVEAKAKQISLINSFVGFLDEVEGWQAHNQETKWKD